MTSNSTLGFALITCPECRRELPFFPLPHMPVSCPCGSAWLTVRADLTPEAQLGTVQVRRSVERGDTYAIVDSTIGPTDDVARAILCLHADCPAIGRPSYHPQDIAQRYCGGCHRFHARAP